MRHIKLFAKLALFAASAIGLCASAYLLYLFITSTGESEISRRTSPDGMYTVFEFRSGDDGVGHAPYGTSLSLSKRGELVFSEAEGGHVIFAGYCRDPLEYGWRDNATITVTCRGLETKSVLTHAVMTRGIRVELKAE
jgi:hypothetical protein